jgi:phage terminase large subunit
MDSHSREALLKDLQDSWHLLSEQEQELAVKLLTPTTEENLARWRNDPAAYLEERLGIQLWPKLIEICEAVRDYPFVAVKSANGIGKTHTVAGLVLWFLECFTPSRALTTGSMWGNLEDILWPRIKKFIHEKNLFPDARVNQTDLTIGPEHGAYAKSVKEPEALQGLHSEHVLQIVEEASGVEQLIADALDGNHTGGHARQVWIGNPIRVDGPFYEYCTGGHYKVITVSALEHPNVVEGREIIKGAVTREDIEKRCFIKGWAKRVAPGTEGATHLFWLKEEGWVIGDERFQARILGEFPKQSSDSVFSGAVFREMAARHANMVIEGSRALGVDVARYGDDSTVIADLCPNGVVSLDERKGKSITETVGTVTAKWKVNGLDADGNSKLYQGVAVDDAGLGGGVTDGLRENNIEAMASVFGSAADDSERFANKKAELYWRFKEETESNPDYAIPDDADLIKQASEVKYKFDSKGRVAIESKADYKKRTGMSPDKLEAVLIGFWALTNSGPSSPPSSGSDSGDRYSRGMAEEGYSFESHSRYRRNFDD